MFPKLWWKKDIIFNFAAQVDHNYSSVDPILDLDINCKGHLTILESCKKYNNKVHGCDPFVGKKIKTTYKIYNKINKSLNYDVIMFLSCHRKFEKIFKDVVSYKNTVLDPFNYYS